MKYYLAVMASMILLISCQKGHKEKETKVSVSIIMDITDPHQLHPEVESIIPMFGLQDDINRSVLFRISPLTDRQLNPVREIRLKDGIASEKDNAGDDDNFRKRQIIHFYDTVRKSIAQENFSAATDTSLSYSECYMTILKELLKAKPSRIDTAIILAFSDLKEKSSIYNIYTAENRNTLFQHPENVARIFEQSLKIPDSIKHTTLILVYNPKSREDDEVYMKLTEVYRRIFEPRGVTILIQASSKSYYL